MERNAARLATRTMRAEETHTRAIGAEATRNSGIEPVEIRGDVLDGTTVTNMGTGVAAAAEAVTAEAVVGLLPGPGFGPRFAKRAFDLVIASVLLAIFMPFIVAVAVLIKLDSPGPVFYRSTRIGRNGIPFGMLKFRTMFDGADRHRESLRNLSEAPEGLFKLSSDPRLTGIGRVLRSTSLDELPQLFHVITGTMSLVGPRPLVAEESALIAPNEPRFQARPGVTGPWQLAGSWRVPLDEMIRLDTDYLVDWSVWTDVKMLAGTAAYAAKRAGV